MHTYFDECQTENEAVSTQNRCQQKTETQKHIRKKTLPLESYGTGMYFLEGFGLWKVMVLECTSSKGSATSACLPILRWGCGKDFPKQKQKQIRNEAVSVYK